MLKQEALYRFAKGQLGIERLQMKLRQIDDEKARVRAASRGKEPLMLKASRGRRRSSVDIQGRPGGESGHASEGGQKHANLL